MSNSNIHNSIAIWAENHVNISDLHINYWIIKRRFSRREHFVDLGVKLNNWQGGKLSVYFPMEVKPANIIELAHELKDKNLASALFNENCEVHLGQNSKRFEVDVDHEKLTVFAFDLSNDVEIESKYSGSVIGINVPDVTNNWYLRFRVRCNVSLAKNVKDVFQVEGILAKFSTLKDSFSSILIRPIRSVFSENHTPSGSFYQSVRNSMDAIDFRLNDKRTLNSSLLDERQSDFIKFRKIHFFLINDQKEELSFSSLDPYKIRLLEKSVWSGYLKDVSGNERKYCATHWMCKEVDAWGIFIKTKFYNSNYMTILGYLAFAFVFGLAVNAASAYTQKNWSLELIKSTIITWLHF